MTRTLAALFSATVLAVSMSAKAQPPIPAEGEKFRSGPYGQTEWVQYPPEPGCVWSPYVGRAPGSGGGVWVCLNATPSPGPVPWDRTTSPPVASWRPATSAAELDGWGTLSVPTSAYVDDKGRVIPGGRTP